MPKCTIERLATDNSPDHLQTIFTFCHTITEPNTNGFGWPSELQNVQNLDQLQTNLHALASKSNYDLENLQHGYIPQQYWWVKNAQGTIIGIAKLRYVLTPPMLQHGGHIGFGLTEPYRGQGYGTAAFALLLQECHRNGLDDALVTINPNNFASRRMVEKNGGQLWDIIFRDGQDIARYWIHYKDL